MNTVDSNPGVSRRNLIKGLAVVGGIELTHAGAMSCLNIADGKYWGENDTAKRPSVSNLAESQAFAKRAQEISEAPEGIRLTARVLDFIKNVSIPAGIGIVVLDLIQFSRGK